MMVCMCVCMCVYTYIHIHTHLSASVWSRIYVCMYVHNTNDSKPPKIELKTKKNRKKSWCKAKVEHKRMKS